MPYKKKRKIEGVSKRLVYTLINLLGEVQVGDEDGGLRSNEKWMGGARPKPFLKLNLKMCLTDCIIIEFSSFISELWSRLQ